MITHDLVKRGIDFEDAYAIARAVRDDVSDSSEVSTAELRDLIEERLQDTLGERALTLASQPPAPPVLQVIYGEDRQPFSRGLLSRSLFAAGLDLDRAYALALELHGELAAEGVTEIERRELGRRVGDLLERLESKEVAGRYRLVRRIRRLPRPLVIYCAGATGTGKSTLSLELAPLLRIYRINATDTIRQVMRMVFSSTILPALHRSSFELDTPERSLEVGSEEWRQELIAAYEEQATRVCVGVRAVVERSIAESASILVEGVHLLPSLVPFPDLEGAAYQQMILLSTLDEEVHRSHLLARSDLERGPSDRYLDHFPAIRELQRYLLAQAEEHDVPLLDATDRDELVPAALRVLTSTLQRRLPWLVEARQRPPTAKALLLILDGAPDRPLRALGGRTPLEAAETPHLDRLAREGRVGLADPVGPNIVPDTASGNLAIFGQAPRSMKRGPLEALGSGLKLGRGDIAVRGNFATLDARGHIIDRRAGRIREEAHELTASLDGCRLETDNGTAARFRVSAGTEHRLAIVLRGEGLSSAILGSDTGDGAPPGPPLRPRPLDPEDARAAETAELLWRFEKHAKKILSQHPINEQRRRKGLPEANVVLTRGAGRLHRLRAIDTDGQELRLACVAGDRTLLGLTSFLGGTPISSPRLTANLDSDLDYKFELAEKALRDHQLVVVHCKGADIAAHDRRSDLKVDYLERLDRALGSFLDKVPPELRIAVASDHTTLSEGGHHAADPVPVLLWGAGIEADSVKHFDERSAATGSLSRFPLQYLIERLFEPTLGEGVAPAPVTAESKASNDS